MQQAEELPHRTRWVLGALVGLDVSDGCGVGWGEGGARHSSKSAEALKQRRGSALKHAMKDSNATSELNSLKKLLSCVLCSCTGKQLLHQRLAVCSGALLSLPLCQAVLPLCRTHRPPL